MGPELRDARWMVFKAVCFGVIIVLIGAALLVERFSWLKLGMICVMLWAAARLYYFCFYVIERYIDPSFRFSGIGSVMAYLINGSGAGNDQEDLDRRG